MKKSEYEHLEREINSLNNLERGEASQTVTKILLSLLYALKEISPGEEDE